jgi:hypothetical protein
MARSSHKSRTRRICRSTDQLPSRIQSGTAASAAKNGAHDQAEFGAEFLLGTDRLGMLDGSGMVRPDGVARRPTGPHRPAAGCRRPGAALHAPQCLLVCRAPNCMSFVMLPSHYSDADHTRDSAITHWIMAVGMAGATVFVSSFMPLPWVFDLESPDFNPMVAVPPLLGGVSAFQLFHAIRWTTRYRRFGTAKMDLKGTGTVLLGTRVEGVIRTARPLQPDGPFRVVLQCVDTHEFHDIGGAAAGPDKTESHVVWKEELEIPSRGIDSTRGIPFSFQLPQSVGPKQMRSSAPTGSPYFKFKVALRIPGMRRIWTHNEPPTARMWQLDASASMAGTDFHAQFIVPVQQD